MMEASAALVTRRSGHWTVIPELEVLSPRVDVASLVAVAVAVLLTVPQVLGVVGEVMWTCLLTPLARSPKAQVSVPAAIEHCAAPVPPSMLQLRPGLEGRVSVRVTFLAMPAPVFVRTMVKPTWSAALTGLASALLVTCKSGQSTVMP